MEIPNGNAFIGQENLQHIADKFSPQIIMGATYYRPTEFDRHRILITSGLQYKDTITVFNRKGGLTRRKKVGEDQTIKKIGYLQERILTGYQTILRAEDNQDNYRESQVAQVEGSSKPAYPLSEAAFLACTQTYGEDLFANLFFGDATDGKEGMDLYDGYHTDIAKDIADGNISIANGNLVAIDAITKPTTETDTAAYDAFVAFHDKWNTSLQNAELVLVYCSQNTGSAIAMGYKNSWRSNKGVNRITTGVDSGNFTIDEYPNVMFVPSSEFGVGDQLIATIPNNFEYGVNTTDSANKIYVQVGTSDKDATDIFFQMQSIQGTRIRKVQKSDFCMTTGTISQGDIPAGDYTKELLTVGVNIAAAGKAVISGTGKTDDDVYAKGVALTLTATANEGYTFVRWSDGNTTAAREYVTKGIPDTVTAIFKKNA